MPYLLRMPSTKRVADGVPQDFNVQKGPTCWYYAMRLVLEFHHAHWGWMVKKYELKLPAQQPESLPQEVEVNLEAAGLDWAGFRETYRYQLAASDQRKLETELEPLETAWRQQYDTAESDQERKTKLHEIIDTLHQARPLAKIDQVKQTADLLLTLPNQDPLGGTISIVQQDYREQAFGARKTPGILVAVGFVGIVLQDSIGALAQALREHGPLVISGYYASKDRQLTRTITERYLQPGLEDVHGELRLIQTPAKRDVMVYQAQAFLDEFHAIVVCGVIDQMVFYHDPNSPLQLCQMAFDDLYERMDRQVDDQYYYYACSVPCPHLAGASIIDMQ